MPVDSQMPAVSPGSGRTGTQPAPARPLWYAELPARRSRQVLADVLVAVWCGAWVLVGTAVHGAVSALVAPTRSLADGAGDTADQLRAGGDQVARLPLVGEDAATPFRAAAGSVGDIAGSATRLADQVGDLALLLAVLVPLTPVAIVLLLWLPARLGFARRAGAARALADDGADVDLFALRALATQPLPRLAAVSADPVGDWRRGEGRVVRDLAALELRRLGLRPR